MRGGVSVSLTHPLAVLVSLFFEMEGGGFPLNGGTRGLLCVWALLAESEPDTQVQVEVCRFLLIDGAQCGTVVEVVAEAEFGIERYGPCQVALEAGR